MVQEVELMSSHEAAQALSELIRDKYITQRAAAKVWGVSEAFVSKVVKGRAPLTLTMQSELGVRRTVSYVRTGGGYV